VNHSENSKNYCFENSANKRLKKRKGEKEKIKEVEPEKEKKKGVNAFWVKK